MTGPKLRDYQSEAHPTAEQRLALAREYATERHVPRRSCLGCGGTLPDRWYGQCHGWGVEAWRATDRPADEFSPIYVECFRLSWAEVQRLVTAEGLQLEMAL